MLSVAFDAHAAGYDDIAESALGFELRRRVHRVVAAHTAPGDTVVDLGCGSGIDAAWLAPQVRSVRAFDASSEMVALTRQRCTAYDNVTAQQVDVAELALDEPVDVVLVNFGVINCVGDLGRFGERLGQMVKPGGDAIIVTMPRWCPFELAIGVATVNQQLVSRRSPTAGHEADYAGLGLHYASARQLARAFGNRFDLTYSESLGIVLPPFEQRAWVQQRPRLLGALATLDQRLSRFAARAGIGDHHIAVLRRRA